MRPPRRAAVVALSVFALAFGASANDDRARDAEGPDAEGEVVERATLAAPVADVQRALLDVQRWPTLFRDIAAVADVKTDARGVVRAMLTSKTTKERHAVEVRAERGAVVVRIDEALGVVVTEVFELHRVEDGACAASVGACGAIVVTVRARAEMGGVLRALVSDDEVRAQLQSMVHSDVADLVHRFGGARVQHSLGEDVPLGAGGP